MQNGERSSGNTHVFARESVSGRDRGSCEIGRDFKIKNYNKIPRNSKRLRIDNDAGFLPTFGSMLPAFRSIQKIEKILKTRGPTPLLVRLSDAGIFKTRNEGNCMIFALIFTYFGGKMSTFLLISCFGNPSVKIFHSM